MSSKKKTDKMTLLDVIKSLRRELPPKGKTFRVKKDVLPRKQKHKRKIDITSD